MNYAVSKVYLYCVKNPWIYIAFIAITLSVWSCKTAEKQAVLTEASFNIDTAYTQGDTLFALVSYSGGCGDHTFAIEPNGPMLKSLPPKQPMRIVHRSDGDPCRAMIIEELKYDISKFRGTPRGTTFILLENWKPTLSYSY